MRLVRFPSFFFRVEVFLFWVCNIIVVFSHVCGSRMTDSKEKLNALLLKLGEYLPFATEGACTKVFGDLASFAQAAATVREARATRQHGLKDSVELTYLDPPIIPTRTFCGPCKKYYRNEIRCDDCGCVFYWCCAGYEHEPCDDPFSCVTGVCVTLQRYCRTCLSRLAIAAERVLGQETDYLELEVYFSRPGCEWRWIPCYSDGYVVFSVTWLGLEGMNFMFSAFYCDVRTERDDRASRNNADFLSFVSSCASQALEITAFSQDMGQEREKWIRIRDNPSVPPKLQFAQFDLAWRAVCKHLKSDMATCIRIWKYVADGALVLEKNYESESDPCSPMQNIDVLMWNTKVATHFDLLRFEPSQSNYDLDFPLLN